MRKSTRLIALLMTLLMLVGMMPFSTFAVPSADDHDHSENQHVGESVSSTDVADIKAKVEAMGGTLHYFDNFEAHLGAGKTLEQLAHGEGATINGVVGTLQYKSRSGALHVARVNDDVALKFQKKNDNADQSQDTFLSLALGNIAGKDIVLSFDYKHGGTPLAVAVNIGARYKAVGTDHAFKQFSVVSFTTNDEILASLAGDKVIGYVNGETYTTIAVRIDVEANKIYYYVNGAYAAEGTMFSQAYLDRCTAGNDNNAVTSQNIKIEQFRMFAKQGVEFPEAGIFVDNMLAYYKDMGGDLGYIYENDVEHHTFIEKNDRVYYLLNNTVFSGTGNDTKVNVNGVDYYFNGKGEVLAADRISLVDVSEHLGSGTHQKNTIFREQNGVFAVKSHSRSSATFGAGTGLVGGATLGDFLEATYVEWNVYTNGIQENTVIPLFFNFNQDYTIENGSKKPLNVPTDINFGSGSVKVYTSGAALNKTYKGAASVNGWTTITRESTAFDTKRLPNTLAALEAAGKTAFELPLENVQLKTGEDWGGDTSYTKAIYAADGTTEILNVDYAIYFTSINLVKYLRPATSVEDMEMTGWVNMANGDKYYFPHWDHKLVKGATVDIDGVAYVFDDDGKLVGKANGIHTVQFGGVHYYKDGVKQLGDADSKYVDGDNVYAINASGDYLGSYAGYTFAKEYADIERKYERSSYLTNINFNDLELGAQEKQGTVSPKAENTAYLGSTLGAVRRGTYSEIVKDADGDYALKWSAQSPRLHTYLQAYVGNGSVQSNNVAISFDIKLGEDWNCSSSILEVIARESGNVFAKTLDINQQGYLLFGNKMLGAGNEIVVAKLSNAEYTNITVVLRTPGLNSSNSKYTAYADVYINGAKIIDNEIFYNDATKMTYVNELRMFQFNNIPQVSSMYIDDFYAYALEEGELPDNVDADWVYKGPLGVAEGADGVNFYFGKNGVLGRGEKNVDGDVYLFETVNCAAVRGVKDGKYYDNGKRDDASVGLVTKADGLYYFNTDHTVKVNENIVDGVKTYVIAADGLVDIKYANAGGVLFDAGDLRKYNNGSLAYNKYGSELSYSMLAKDKLNIMSDGDIDLSGADVVRIKMYIPEQFDDSKIMFILRRQNWYYKLSGDPANQTVEISTEHATETEMLAGGKFTKTGPATINGKANQRYAEYTRNDGTLEYYTYDYTYYKPSAYTQLSELGSGWVTFDLVLANYTLEGDKGPMTLADVYTIEWVNSGNSGKDCYISSADADKKIKFDSVYAINYGEKDETLNGVVGDYLYEDGVPQTGWQNIGGDFYYLDPATGKKATGIKYIPSKMPTGVANFASNEGLYYDFGESGICNGVVNGIREVEIPVVTDDGVVTKTVSRLFQAGVVASNGLVTNELDNNTYYADPETGALVKGGTVKIDGTIYTFDENGVSAELNGWYEDEETGNVFYNDPINGLAHGLTVITIEGVDYYFYFDETTNALKLNYWSDEYSMYFGNDGKAANGMLTDVVIGGTTNDRMYFVDGTPSAGTVDLDGIRYVFGDDGKLASTIDLTVAEVVITIKKDNNTDVLNFKPSMGAMFIYTVPNYLDYDVTVYDKDMNEIPADNGTVMIVIEAVTGYTEYTIVYSEKTVSHDWILKLEFSTPATCMDDGLNVYECSVCGKIKKEVVSKSTAEHVFNPFVGVYCSIDNCNHLACGGWAKAREESCTTAGIRYTYCTVCNKGISYETIAASHEWNRDTFTVILEPKCYEEGLAEYKCKNCPETLVEEFRDTNNLYHAGPISTEIIKAPTCVAKGVEKHTCAQCGGTWTDTVDEDPNNHAWLKDGSTPLEQATCYTGQEKWPFRCADCGERKEDVVDIPATDWIHDYDDGVVDPAPTCGVPGLKTYTCQNPDCNKSYNEIVPATGLHNWETGEGNYVYDPNHTLLPNHHWYECTVCGEKYDVEEHSITNWTENANGTHSGSCICGYTVVDQPHEYVVDGNGDKVYFGEENDHWYQCAICNAKLDVTAHAYDDKKGDTQHWKECECGKVIDQNAHDYSIPMHDDEYHWNECSCGAIDQKIEHTFTQKHDENNHWNECECTFKKDVTAHEYVFENGDRVYSTDAGYHWFDCKNCEYDDEKEAHDHVATYDNDYHWNECECGDFDEKIAHECEQKFDATNHWYECDCGFTKDNAQHVYATDKNGDRVYTYDSEKHWYECTECDYIELKDTHSLEQKYDANDHWKLCPDCGYTTEKVAHNITAIMEAKDPTCTQPGNSEGSWCEDCGLIFVPVEYYGQLSHDMINILVSDANGHYYACRNCTTKLDYEGHIFEEEWTCNEKEHKRVCIVCNARDAQSGAHKYIEDSYTNVDDEEGTATARCEFCGYETEVKVATWYEKLGMIKVDGKYYFPVEGVNVTNKLVEFVDGVRFFGADGALVLTASDPDGIDYITFQNARGVIDDAVITLDEGAYCVKKSVIQKDKLVVIGTHYYYFDENGLMVKDEIVDVDGNGTPDYWFDENGMGYKLVISDVKSATVTIKDHNGDVLSEKTYYDDTEAIVFPDVPTKTGYSFVKWSMTSDEVKTAIANGETAIEITPVFELIDVKYTLTVNDEGHTDGQYTVTDLAFKAQYTVIACGVTGKHFAGWYLNGVLVSTQSEYTVNIIGDEEITAVYDDEPVELAPVITLTAVAVKDVNDRSIIVYTITRDVPAGYTVVSNGLILTVNGTDRVNPSASNVVPGTFIYNFNVDGHEVVCIEAKGYLEVLKDGETETEFIYTDAIVKSYKELETE